MCLCVQCQPNRTSNRTEHCTEIRNTEWIHITYFLKPRVNGSDDQRLEFPLYCHCGIKCRAVSLSLFPLPSISKDLKFYSKIQRVLQRTWRSICQTHLLFSYCHFIGELSLIPICHKIIIRRAFLWKKYFQSFLISFGNRNTTLQ